MEIFRPDGAASLPQRGSRPLLLGKNWPHPIVAGSATSATKGGKVWQVMGVNGYVCQDVSRVLDVLL